VIQRVRVENPIAYFKGMLSLLQKEVSLDVQTERPRFVRFARVSVVIASADCVYSA